MPRGDGMGPNGMGSRTGRQMGFCAGYNRPGFANTGGRGFGRGFARQPYMPYYGQRNVDTKESLEDEATYLEEQLAAVKARQANLKK